MRLTCTSKAIPDWHVAQPHFLQHEAQSGLSDKAWSTLELLCSPVLLLAFEAMY